MKSNSVVIQLKEKIQDHSFLKNLIQILGASFLIALCAQIKIPLPFTPVPMTLQTFAVMLSGVLLGSYKGTLAVLAYLVQAMLGFQVTALAAGPLVLFGPTGGYLFGMVVQAALAGFTVSVTRSFWLLAVLLCGSCALQLMLGGLWLASFVGWNQAFLMGVLPFLVGESFKSVIVAAVCKGKAS